jgi:hypothetical protein
MNPYMAIYYAKAIDTNNHARPPSPHRPRKQRPERERKHAPFAKLVHLRRHGEKIVAEVAAGMSDPTTPTPTV